MDHLTIQIGRQIFGPAEIGFGLGIAGLFLLFVLFVMMWRGARARALQSEREAVRAQEFEAGLQEMMKVQAEMTGRLQTVAEIATSRQSDLSRSVNERLDRVSHRLGENMEAGNKRTSESLSKLHERLAVIDTAQANIMELSNNVVTLQGILANKQERGAFGQGRMEAIISDGLPSNAFSFQATLSNKTRPDCLIHLPNAAADIVIDAKFPLEGFNAHREARLDAEKKTAASQVKKDVTRHITHISDKYLIPGETQDTAIMFVPSESIYADLYENFPGLVESAHKARVFIASPNILMLAVQTMQAILKDVRMREQAGVIQKEVGTLLKDVHRLHDRALNLERHFAQASRDVDEIQISTEKITRRGRRIETLEFEAEGEPGKPVEAEVKDEGGASPRLIAGE